MEVPQLTDSQEPSLQNLAAHPLAPSPTRTHSHPGEGEPAAGSREHSDQRQEGGGERGAEGIDANLDPKASFGPLASPAAAPFLSRNPRDAAGTSGERDAPRGVSTVGDAAYRSAAKSPHGGLGGEVSEATGQNEPARALPGGSPSPGGGWVEDGREGQGVRTPSDTARASFAAVPPPALATQASLTEEAPERRQPIVPRTVARAEPVLRWPDSPRSDVPSGEVRAPARHEAGPSPDAEPTVRVTIGRIEVRAVAPATPPAPAARPAGPRLTLEEYVRRRNEGRM